MKIEGINEIDPLLVAQAAHRFYFLHETKENLCAQLRITKLELEMALRKARAISLKH
jgi:hypothetical protein